MTTISALTSLPMSLTLGTILVTGTTNLALAQNLPTLPQVSSSAADLTNDSPSSNSDPRLFSVPQTLDSFRPAAGLSQVTGVNQLTDIYPGDWAYQALDDLIRRYDCLKGYPNGTFRGNRALSRSEFAAGLNACAHVIETLLLTHRPIHEQGSHQDLDPLRRQIQDVERELATLNAQIEALLASDRADRLPQTTLDALRRLAQDFDTELATLNAQLEDLPTRDRAELVTLQDLDTLQRLMQGFEPELAQLGSQVDGLETRVQFLADNQFSTTTKLYGQVVLGLQGRFPNSIDFRNNTTGAIGSDGQTDIADPNTEISMGYNAQLTLVTQLDPKSYLLTGMQAGNLETRVANPANYGLVNNNFIRLGYESDTANQLVISDVNLRQLITDNLALIVGPAGVNPVNVFRGPSRVESAGFGPISRFAQRNPIIQLGGTSAGIGFDWLATPILSVQGVYSAAFANLANVGLFDDSYTLGIQALITPTPTTDIALYFLNGQSGASQGYLNTFIGDEQISSLNGVDLDTHAFGVTANWAITDGITLGGWIGWTTSRQLNFSGSAQTNNWMVSLQFPDLFAEGNYGGIFFGVPPRITESNLTNNGIVSGNIPSFFKTGSTAFNGGRDDTAYHLEAFYRLRLTDNITITPGVMAVFNPGHNANNDTVTIGVLRTTFSF